MLKWNMLLTLAALAFAAPAQALTSEQERCAEDGIAPELHAAMIAEYRANQPDGPAYQAFVRAAVQCAVTHDLDAAKHPAYVIFAVSRSIGTWSESRLRQAGYPLDLLDRSLKALITSAGGPDKVFSLETGLTGEAFAVLAEVFRRYGQPLVPKDEAGLGDFSDLIFSLAEVNAVSKELGLEIF